MPLARLIQLDSYLPARIDANISALVWQVSEQAIVVDLDQPLSRGKPCTLQITARPDLVVTVRASVEAVESVQGRWRHRLEVHAEDRFAGSPLAALLSTLRKAAHLKLVREEDVEAQDVTPGWAAIRLRHDALPELALEQMDTRTSFLGRSLSVPFLVAGMTGGTARAGEINRSLARVAERFGMAFGLGSQRAMHETPELEATYAVRDVAPNVVLLANIGAVQLNRGLRVEDVRALVQKIGADALAVHLNVAQELVQPEGDTDFRGLKDKIAHLVADVGVPVILKETGSGIGGSVARWAESVGIAAIDVGGAGGTSWTHIEGLRAADAVGSALGDTFRDWGIPTARAVIECVREAPRTPILATGGLRSGLDAAEALALGAQLAGFALPFFRAADTSEAAAEELAQRYARELRVAMMCAGARTIEALQHDRVLQEERR